MFILFDIGATKTRIALSADGLAFEEPRVLATPPDYDGLLKMLADNSKELAKGGKIGAACGGMSRMVAGGDYEKLKTDLSKALGAETLIENDAAVAGLGEANFGAGRGSNIVAYITVSTGVGGARIVGGKMDESSVGFEPGKQIMDVDTGETLEQMVSGKSLFQKTGKNPKEITDESVWDDLAQKLAAGLHNIIVEWSPDCIVLGGSMITGEPAISLEKTEERLKEILKIFPSIPAIKKAELGDFGGLHGALAYIKSLSLA